MGIHAQEDTLLTALCLALFKAIGMTYRHLNAHIGKGIVPGPTVGCECGIWGHIKTGSPVAGTRSARPCRRHSWGWTPTSPAACPSSN